uniref:Zn(2)-C6 fungal-type domain-containing protein n=1 Tax=Fusarium oxysporum (strain Fo5176) TaxID=660025 RepID=A0A0D2Y6N2_FUSOF
MSEQQPRQRRRKVTLACEPCRERKARCDGVKPLCSTCRRRQLGIEQCIYQLHKISPRPYSPAGAGLQVYTQSQAELDAVVMGISQGQILTPLSSSANESIESSTNARRVTAMGTATSEEGIAQCRDTSQAFYGSSSAASFLNEACGTASPLLARQASRHSQAATLQNPSVFNGMEKFVLPPRALADHLKERYFKRAYYLYPIFDKDAFEHAYESLWLPSGRTSTVDEYRHLVDPSRTLASIC